VEEADIVLPDYRGSYQWSGGLEETYAGMTFRTTDWLAVSLGGRCTFGSILADVTLTPFDPGPPLPVNTVYRDDASFRQAWGAQVGLMVNTPGFSAGLSVVTDREGTVDVLRDFSTQESDTLSERYEIPGELAAGITVRPLNWLLVGVDVYSRKTLNLLGSKTEGGTIVSTGLEAELWDGFAARAGYNSMSGLWRDGSRTITAGAGYSFSEGIGGIDLSAGYQYWNDELDEHRDEMILYVSLWATERWLGD